MSASPPEGDGAVSSDSSDEEFVEASSTFPPRQDPGAPVDVASGLEAIQTAIDMMNANQFAETEAMLQPWADTSMYHCAALGTVFFLQAVLSLEQDDVAKAISTLNKAVHLCNSQRKHKGIIESITSWVFGSKLDSYSQAELQAEIMHAEANMLLSMLTFLQDENLLSFIKGGLRIRSCHSSYKSLYAWLETCEQNGTEVEPNFDCGVRMGVGSFNLFISLLPGRILRLLEFIGFSGDRTRGLTELMRATQCNSFRAPLCSSFLLFFHACITKLLGIDGESVEHCEDLLRPQIERYPNSVQFLFFKGRLQLMRGNVDEAMVWYNRTLEMQDYWEQVYHLCWWELMWCHCFKSEWEAAASYADKLYNHSKWSKATFLYQKAIFLLMGQRYGHSQSHASIGEASPGVNLPDVTEMMRGVAPLKQRIAGKSLPVEKFVIAKTERHFQGERLPLPGMEMLYAWNMFSLLASNETLLRTMLQQAAEELAVVEESKDSNPSYVDNWVVATLINGVMLKELHKYEEAKQCFLGVLSRKHEVQRDRYALAAAGMELGMLCIETGERDEAKRVLEHTKTAFKGYHLESRVHFRIHAGQCKLKAEAE